MAEAFLHELLQMKNSVHNTEERCSICLEEYGSLCRETGTVEIEIRLPCPHTVGSACIAIWLKTNNTCPICRHEFFPAQPRPYLEHGIMDQEYEEDEDGIIPEHEDPRTIRELNNAYCYELTLDDDVSMISGLVVQKLTELTTLTQSHSEGCLIAVAIYIASHLTWEPRCPREISAAVGVDADHIQFTYNLIYPERHQLVGGNLLSSLVNIWNEVPPLDWPAPGFDFADDWRIEHPFLHMVRIACEERCTELQLPAVIATKSARIAETFYAAAADFLGSFSARSVIAVCILMASHLCPHSISLARIAEAVATSENTIRSAYGEAYRNFRQVIEDVGAEDDDREAITYVRRLLPSAEALT